MTEDIRKLAEFIDDSTAARGVDRWAVDELGYSVEEWAELTGRSQSPVALNVRRATGAEQ